MKPDNIMIDFHQEGQDIKIDRVQVIDIENGAYLPQGRCIKGMLPGNENWRSPEGHLRGELNKPADLYSFGIVVRATSPHLCYLPIITNIFSASVSYLAV